MKIETIDIERVIPYARNPRKNAGAVDKVAASLREFGFRQPIVVDENYTVIVGHTRLLAAKKLGMTEVPVHIAEGLTEAQIKAYRIADNRTNEEAEWDIDLLKVEFKDLQDQGCDLSLTAFSEDELQKFLAEATEGLTDPDETPELPLNPKSKLGDIWICGQHRVMCGSATSLDDVDKLMIGTYPDLVHTDPPYGMNAVSKSSVLKERYKTDIIGDDTAETAKDSFRLIYGLYPDAKHIWWGANYYCSALPDSECWLVWDKNNGQSDQTDCELAWANFRSVVRQFTQASEKTNRVHPTQKPVALMEWIIKRFKVSANNIADFFGGSGSTLIAAEKNSIRGFIMELDSAFVDVIVKRWQDFTGKEAVLESSGKKFNEIN
jgi:DNA modification methylase